MTASKLRAVTAVALTALSIGVAAQPPHATKNTGGYHKSTPAQKQQQNCAGDKGAYDSEMASAQRLAAKGYGAAAVKHAQTAKEIREGAKSDGCAWAA